MSVEELQRFLLNKHPDNILMPAKEKAPLHKHTGDKWSWERFSDFMENNKGWSEFCILLRSMVVLDFDDTALAFEWEDKYPILKSCPLQKTRKGLHYFFLRSSTCDELGIYDKSRYIVDGNGHTLEVDVKTVCSTGTAGLIMVHPSSNKSWAKGRALWEIPIPELPEDLSHAIAPPKKKGKLQKRRNDILALPDHTTGRPPFLEMKSLLENTIGFKDVRLVQTRELGYSFDADRTCMCPLCRVRIHDSNHWYIVSICPHLFAVRSYSLQCRQQIIGWEASPEIRELISTPDTDEPYVALFNSVYNGRVMWTGKRFMIFKEHHWRAVSNESIYESISAVAQGVLQRLLEVFGRRRTELDMEPPSKTFNEERDKLDEDYAAIKKGTRYVKRHSNLQHMVEMAKCKLFVDKAEERFDTNPWLLGVRNGVIEISEKDGSFTLRTGEPEDMISKSVGYDFDETSAKEHIAEVEQLFEQIYPVEEEREVVQRYFGYCLLGYHPQKKMLLLTDARGGYNGKSTVCKIIRSVMGGEYSVKSQPTLLYKADRVGSIDSHSAGLLSFRGVRVAAIEELDHKQHLNDSFIKDCTGGRTSFRGRVFGREEQVEFEWITKFVIAFNGGNMPSFDCGDMAMLKRMIVIQHRSRFCPSTSEYENEKHQPHTFMAEPDIDAKIFKEWKSALLLWCLRGLPAYKQKRGFAELPECCEQWVQQLVNQQDLVREFVKNRLQYTGDGKDYVKRADMYVEYKSATPEERDKRTSIGKIKFLERLKKAMGESCFRERHGGHKDVFLGWSWATDCEM